MKLKSFGCSFVYGSDLSDCICTYDSLPEYSHLTWPALIANKLDLDYECCAWPGIGNFKILCDVISHASLNDPALFVINWTWIDRFDFINDTEHWETVMPGQRCKKSGMYYRHFHSHIKDVLDSVYHINTAITFLQEQDIPFVMTYMDCNILDTIDPNWHDPKYLTAMQAKIKPFLSDFEGHNFLDWSRNKKFAVSDGWHPLDQAHEAAADLMTPVIDAILHRA